MKNVIIATLLVLTSVSSFAAMDRGNAEFTGKVQKVCSVSSFVAGTVVIEEGEDGNLLSSESAGGTPATFTVRANARNSVLTFGEPRIRIRRNDGVRAEMWMTNRTVTLSGSSTSDKNVTHTLPIVNSQVMVGGVGNSSVVLNIRIEDTLDAGMIPAGKYKIIVPVTCTKSNVAVNF